MTFAVCLLEWNKECAFLSYPNPILVEKHIVLTCSAVITFEKYICIHGVSESWSLAINKEILILDTPSTWAKWTKNFLAPKSFGLVKLHKSHGLRSENIPHSPAVFFRFIFFSIISWNRLYISLRISDYNYDMYDLYNQGIFDMF